jgi:hypothetical protein
MPSLAGFVRCLLIQALLWEHLNWGHDGLINQIFLGNFQCLYEG